MDIDIDVPLPRILGFVIKVSIPGRDVSKFAKVIECNIPLPPESTDGLPKLTVSMITTEGTQELMAEKNIVVPNLAEAKLKPWIAEQVWYEALGKEAPIQEVLTGAVNRTFRREDGWPKKEKEDQEQV